MDKDNALANADNDGTAAHNSCKDTIPSGLYTHNLHHNDNY